MRNSFVPSLTSPETYEENWKYRVERWEDTCLKEFQLVYAGKFQFSDLENMSVHELQHFYGLLLEQKKSENDAIEKSMSKSHK